MINGRTMPEKMLRDGLGLDADEDRIQQQGELKKWSKPQRMRIEAVSDTALSILGPGVDGLLPNAAS